MSEHKVRERNARVADAAQRTTAHIDSDGNTIVNSYQDVEPAMEHAAALRRYEAEGRGAFGKRRDFHHTLSVPNNIWLQIAAQLGIPAGEVFESAHAKRIVQELKKPEYKAFRATNDRLI